MEKGAFGNRFKSAWTKRSTRCVFLLKITFKARDYKTFGSHIFNIIFSFYNVTTD